jgi:hypothetical protein
VAAPGELLDGAAAADVARAVFDATGLLVRGSARLMQNTRLKALCETIVLYLASWPPLYQTLSGVSILRAALTDPTVSGDAGARGHARARLPGKMITSSSHTAAIPQTS